ncbi:MAG TPA: SRPBCC domain-containing protein [Verrucomicrobiae bacterium]
MNSSAPNAGTVTISRTFAAPVERVWHALTSLDALRFWLFPLSGFKPEVGFEFEFTCPDGKGNDFLHHCRVTEAVPHKLIAYTWRYAGYEGDSLVTFELKPEGPQTRVTVTHTGLDTFPKLESFARSNFEAGWTDIIGPMLEKYLAENPVAPREIVTTRLFSAPRDLVWKTFTDPKHITNWWGPRGFRTTTHAHDLKAGGIWRYTMHGPDGTDYPNEMTYHEVIVGERLSYSHGTGAEDYPHKFEVVTTFVTEGAQTRVTMRSVFQSADSRDFIVKTYGAIEGAIQTLERFEEQLAFAAAKEPFVITRTFDAPRELVWRAFTEADCLLHWWGPTGFKMNQATVDLRPGGAYHYGMSGPGDMTMWGKFTYREIVAPERLIFLLSFSDEKGGITRHPGHAGWPLQMLKVLTLTEQAGKTTLTLRGVPFNATAAEQQVYLEHHSSMQQGFGASWEQLAIYLANTK